MRIPKNAATWIGLIIVILYGLPASAQDQSPITTPKVDLVFGESIIFSAAIDTATQVNAIDLVFKPRTTGRSTVVPASIESDSTIVARYDIPPQEYIPAFSTIEYWFNIQFSDGTQEKSPVFTFEYEDTRFDWQHLDKDTQYQISWVNGDLAFGQSVQDAMFLSFENYSKYLDLPVPDTLGIFIYPNPSALQTALEITNARWIAGHANPAENIILVSIPSGFDQNLDIQRQIPHELTHLRLYLYLGQNYSILPAWYSEGLASLSELYSLPEYWQILQAAWQNNEMIPFSELCQSIPSEANRAALAYAQSDSFVRFLYDEFGKVGLQELLDAYNQGYTCEDAIQTTFNIDLETLEKDWYQQTFNSSILPQSFNTAITWIVLLLLLVAAPIGLTIFTMGKKKSSRR